MTVVATLVVPFGETVSGAGGAIIAEWDDTMNLDDDGEVKSKWLPGDVAYLLVHHDSSLINILAAKATAGSISASGSALLSRDDLLGFSAAGEKQSLQYLPAGALGYDWKGNVGQGASNVGKEVSVASGQFPCMAEIEYPVAFGRYRLQTPLMSLAADETFPVRVYIYYEEITT